MFKFFSVVCIRQALIYVINTELPAAGRQLLLRSHYLLAEVRVYVEWKVD